MLIAVDMNERPHPEEEHYATILTALVRSPGPHLRMKQEKDRLPTGWHALSANGTLLLFWENVYVGRDFNKVGTVQVELSAFGDVAYRFAGDGFSMSTNYVMNWLASQLMTAFGISTGNPSASNSRDAGRTCSVTTSSKRTCCLIGTG